MKLRALSLPAALYAAFLPLASAAESEFLQCASRPNDSERLKCYDDLASARLRTSAPFQVMSAEAAPVGPAPEIVVPERERARKERSYLTRTWNLDGRNRENGTQLTPLRPYRTSYLIARTSSRTNRQPASPAPGHTTATPLDLDALEAKFQFSFKAEIMNYRQIDWLGFNDFRLWGAYTQQSNWQAFNARNSSPFRETNYEPELIATFGTGNTASSLKMVNLGLVHQSNGKGATNSRSWNRAYVQGGWEWDNNLSMLARGWWRIPESVVNDDNPDIEDFVGRADAMIRWEPSRTQSVTLLLRNNLYLGHNRGFMQLDWTTPVFVGKSAKLHAQVTTGYGESLIDYNHRQTTFGLGVSFREW
ncbi:MAG: phospholipase A [Gallionella sp.]|jgi:phospholipase A1|nr:phospholipase A [Gallionella sp.]MCK9353437.1 phospholipase A [Gallionella sp.]